MNPPVTENAPFYNVSLYDFSTIFLDEKDKKYVRKVKIYQFFQHKKKIYQFLTLNFDFGKDYEHISPVIRSISYLFNEIVLEIAYRDEDYTEIISQKVENVSAIKKEWQQVKNRFLLNHQGVVIESYFKSIDEMFEDQDKFIAFLYQNSMFGVYLKSKKNGNSIFYSDTLPMLKETFFEEGTKRYEVLCKKYIE